ncbi:MAG TPA: efflux RND transporter periplasmic adaptor subunit [Casimicrobiaceae bacterium]|nr:efflux RND transporter periplasmic adaptor subunit [Casimicrobiaceae bacterium]
MNRTLVGSALVGSAAIAAVVYGAYEFGVRSGRSNTPPTATTETASADAMNTLAPTAERKVLYWHDPMVPGHRFEKPGKSPFMDMQLVPVYADEAQGTGVSVSPQMQQNLGLRTALVRRAPLATMLEASGVVTQNERATVVVQSRTPGYVEKLFVRATLDPVSKGQPLVTIYAPEWAGALTEYLALRNANIDAAIVAAARERLRLLSIPDDVVARAEREGSGQTRFTLTSPISGVVAELGVRDGVMVQPGMPLFRIVDLSSVWIEANIPEAQAGEVRVGSTARATTDAYPNRTFSGKVGAILPQVDAATRTLRARLEVANPGTALKPGMFVSVTIGSGQQPHVLAVPQEAVIATGKRTVVIVAGEDNRFTPVDVTPGRPVGADVEVKSGLTEGQRVVTSSQFLIDSEASLKSALPRLEAGGTAKPIGGTASYKGEGRIEKIGKDEVTLSHAPIAALKWPSMTMGFKNPPSGPPQELKVGDSIQFEFVEKNGSYELIRIERAGVKR